MMAVSCGDERGAMTKLPWFEALKFSLRVMRKSFFKLFIPSMALSYVMGGLLALIVIDDDPMHLFTTAPPLIILIFVLLICIVALPIYAYLYPLLKRHVLFLGMQELCPHVLMDYKKSLRKIDFNPFSDFFSISLNRYLFQSLSFLLLFVLPFVLLFFVSFLGAGNIVWLMGQTIISITTLLIALIVGLLPVAMSYFKCFFAELHAIDRLIQEANSDLTKSKKIIRPDKQLLWPILSWKALLLVVYMTLVFTLGILYTRSGMATQSIMDYTNNLLFAIGLPVFLFGFLFQPFFEPVLNAIFKLRMDHNWFIWSYSRGSDIFLDNPNAIWILLFFLLLFGLLTAFFFLVETLSTVYFYHRCRGKDDGIEEDVNEHQST
jgi:hypothetical protein